jgi:hypothetical protein
MPACKWYRLIHKIQEGSSIRRQNLNEWIESLHLAPALFSHLPGFYLKTGFLNPYSLSLTKSVNLFCISKHNQNMIKGKGLKNLWVNDSNKKETYPQRRGD